MCLRWNIILVFLFGATDQFATVSMAQEVVGPDQPLDLLRSHFRQLSDDIANISAKCDFKSSVILDRPTKLGLASKSTTSNLEWLQCKDGRISHMFNGEITEHFNDESSRTSQIAYAMVFNGQQTRLVGKSQGWKGSKNFKAESDSPIMLDASKAPFDFLFKLNERTLVEVLNSQATKITESERKGNEVFRIEVQDDDTERLVAIVDSKRLTTIQTMVLRFDRELGTWETKEQIDFLQYDRSKSKIWFPAIVQVWRFSKSNDRVSLKERYVFSEWQTNLSISDADFSFPK